jgi:hypothetical protein
MLALSAPLPGRTLPSKAFETCLSLLNEGEALADCSILTFPLLTSLTCAEGLHLLTFPAYSIRGMFAPHSSLWPSARCIATLLGRSSGTGSTGKYRHRTQPRQDQVSLASTLYDIRVHCSRLHLGNLSTFS